MNNIGDIIQNAYDQKLDIALRSLPQYRTVRARTAGRSDEFYLRVRAQYARLQHERGADVETATIMAALMSQEALLEWWTAATAGGWPQEDPEWSARLSVQLG